MSEISSKVKAIIVDKLVIDESEVTEKSNFMTAQEQTHQTQLS